MTTVAEGCTVSITITDKDGSHVESILVDNNKRHLFTKEVRANSYFNTNTGKQYYTVNYGASGERLYSIVKKKDKPVEFKTGVPLTVFLYGASANRKKSANPTDFRSSAYMTNPAASRNKVKIYTDASIEAFYAQQKKQLPLPSIGLDCEDEEDDFDDLDDTTVAVTDHTVSVSPVSDPEHKALASIGNDSSKPDSATVKLNGVDVSIEDARKILGISF